MKRIQEAIEKVKTKAATKKTAWKPRPHDGDMRRADMGVMVVCSVTLYGGEGVCNLNKLRKNGRLPFTETTHKCRNFIYAVRVWHACRQKALS